MGLISLLREFAKTTSLHGIGFCVQEKLSFTTRVSWAILFTIAVIWASLELRLAIICKFFKSRFFKGGSSIHLIHQTIFCFNNNVHRNIFYTKSETTVTWTGPPLNFFVDLKPVKISMFYAGNAWVMWNPPYDK